MKELNDEEATAYFNAKVNKLMGISGQEFVDRYDRGEYDSHDENGKVLRLEMMLPLAESLRNGRRHP